MTIITIHSDVHDVLPELLEVPIASVITDPPYSVHVHEHAVSAGPMGVITDRDLGFEPIGSKLRRDIATIAEHATRWTAVFSDIESIHFWRESFEAIEYVRTMPWVRWSQPQITGDRPPSGCEMITLAHARGAKHWSGPGGATHFDMPKSRGVHGFALEKPLDLMLDLVSWFSDAGEIVCDPCAGSGTTGLACRILERDAILVELDIDTARRAQMRCDAPLAARDAKRLERWIEKQRRWLSESPPPDSTAGNARRERAENDLARVMANRE